MPLGVHGLHENTVGSWLSMLFRSLLLLCARTPLISGDLLALLEASGGPLEARWGHS